ncbi:PorP/SprF family type IX secretion system membrane protein [Aureivirga marina]|uniref:PorP/SprF family type IX secretion system membrane protein n=1 Tax=Aureivirga marina TaxID=1182451 RepID=UPI0018CA656F|nr:type IX secretion system membrane protein PorP/SprF [Aureivirga marina]
MKKIKKLLLGIIVFLPLTIFAQQDPQYTQYYYNMNVVNPAYAGSSGDFSVGILGRTQWVGMEGAPRTATVVVQSPVGDRVGLGFSGVYDQIGPVKETNLYGDFSYTLFLSDEVKLALGLKAGVTFQDIGLLSLTTLDENDPLFDENVSKAYPNLGVGTFIHTESWYVGFSIPNLLENKHFEKSDGIISNASEQSNYFLTGGYVFDITEDLKFKPSTLVRGSAGSPLTWNLAANVLLQDKVEFGMAYRWNDAITALAGFNLSPGFKVAYAYDYTLNNLGRYNSGSHEIVLLFNFSRTNIYSPRFF